MERKDFSFLSGIARLKERKSPSPLETIESNILNLISLKHASRSPLDLFLLLSLNFHEEKKSFPWFPLHKKPRILEKNGRKIFVFYKRLFENHNLESGWVRLPQKLLRLCCIPIRCISIVLVMYSNLMYCFVSAIVLYVYAFNAWWCIQIQCIVLYCYFYWTYFVISILLVIVLCWWCIQIQCRSHPYICLATATISCSEPNVRPHYHFPRLARGERKKDYW